tara:strand:- start:306 stop:506 length:201 start_codon:yes stop_codon:yes gene_type:complete
MADKFGPYITKLMATVLDFKEDEFVRGLAIEELRRLNVDIEEFIRKQYQEDEEETKTEKTLLQEDK